MKDAMTSADEAADGEGDASSAPRTLRPWKEMDMVEVGRYDEKKVGFKLRFL